MKYIIYLLKGIFIGGTMLVPGVSGGTMAMALGMYHKLISSVANIRKQFKEGLCLLLPFAVGGLLGALLLSAPIEKLKELYELPVMYFFVGSIAGSIPMMFKKAYALSDDKKMSLRDIFCILIGGVISFLFNMPKLFGSSGALLSANTSGILGFAVLLGVGLLCSISLMLPGISTSFMLTVLGVYDGVLHAFSSLDVLYLLPIAIGALVGMLVFSKIIEHQLKYRPRASYTVILGFILGSLVCVFPYRLPLGFEWLFCPLLFAAAFIAMFMLSKYEK